MSTDERLDRLEQRMAVLERLVRELVAQRSAAPVPAAARPAAPASVFPEAAARSGLSRPEPAAAPAPAFVPAGESAVLGTAPATGGGAGPRGPRVTLPDAERLASRLGSEEWFGQRFLLTIGVGALIVAAGYLLKLAFDREWISPLARCVLGAGAGAAVGALGWRLQPRYRTYGASLIGCGAAIVYLCVWAACSRYTLLPPLPGIVGLALVSVALAAIAWAIDVEALGATAALGALFAPILLGRAGSQANVLLLYLASMSAGLGAVAARKRWRLATLVIAASFYLLGGLGGADRADPAALLLYGVAGGTAGLWLGLREGWWETRFLAFWGGWGMIAAAGERLGPAWPLLAGAIVMATPVWLYALRTEGPWGLRPEARSGRPGAALDPALGEALYFLATPLLLGWAVHRQAPGWFGAHAGAAAAIVALPYLAAGYGRMRPPFAFVGAAALGVAAWLQWPGVAATVALVALALAWAALDHLLDRTDGRYWSLATFGAAFVHLYAVDALRRPLADPAFVGAWALGLWAVVGGAVALAARLWRDGPRAEENRAVRGVLWTLAGLFVFFGVTTELGRQFGERPGAAVADEFARGLAVTSWWLLAGAVLVGVGALRALRAVRLAGFLSVAAALSYLLLVDFNARDAADPAFWGSWALVLWLSIVVVTTLAVGVGRWAAEQGTDDTATRALWIVAGALVLLGVSGELDRYFGRLAPPGSTAALQAGLSISAWWLLFAAALVVAGFRRARTALRRAGLGVAALAAAKVVLYDLASLDALYRVASVLILGIVFLSLAYLYHRQARLRMPEPADAADASGGAGGAERGAAGEPVA